jgi:hypothetical protein
MYAFIHCGRIDAYMLTLEKLLLWKSAVELCYSFMSVITELTISPHFSSSQHYDVSILTEDYISASVFVFTDYFS